MTRLTWNRAVLAAGSACAVFVASPGITPAQASPLTCERRSDAHLAEHGGRLSDDRYHVARGELPNCDNPSERAGSDHDDDGDGFNRHRDRIKPSWRDLF